MSEEEFIKVFRKCVDAAVHFSTDFISNKLPEKLKFTIHFNQSHDSDEGFDYVRYDEDENLVLDLLTEEETIKKIYRNGKNPVWIDIHVHKEHANCTEIKLLCAGRYTNELERMYYNKRTQGPFGIKSPVLPKGYKEGDKFLLPCTIE
ncbi:MAG: hypothetical protein ACJA1C_001203 [Crocinitomicaceae bacterium]|jgi:hypothetical protein